MQIQNTILKIEALDQPIAGGEKQNVSFCIICTCLGVIAAKNSP